MRPMPLIVTSGDLALRLALTVAAGFVIGFNRDEHGRPAGLRTTLLVCLAASLAMIQANLLLPTVGKAHDGFAVADVLRLPLGILSGIGFIGAGAIVRRADLVVGVTTAATLWLVTVIGLCFGGGQITLGIAGAVLGYLVLAGLKLIEERHILRDRRATLVVLADADGPNSADMVDILAAAGFRIAGESVTYSEQAQCREIKYDVRWRSKRSEVRAPEFLSNLAKGTGVRRLQWSPQSVGSA